MNNLLSVDNFEKIEARLNETGLTHIDNKIEYFENKNPEDIDSTLKNLGIKSKEDIKDVVGILSSFKSLGDAIEAAYKMVSSGLINVSGAIESWQHINQNLLTALESFNSMSQKMYVDVETIKISVRPFCTNYMNMFMAT